MEPATTSSTELPGFEKVNVGDLPEDTLTVEDLESRKKQLWLIKVPYEFDVSKLSGATVILNGKQELPVKMGHEFQRAGKRYETRASKYTDKESCPYDVVVPSRNKNCLQVAKGFTGYLDVLQTVKVPMLVYPPPRSQMYTDVPNGLKARWKPFGSRIPPVIDRKSTKDSNESGEVHSTPEKKKKHKTKTKRLRKINEEEAVTEKRSPKKKKNKKESENFQEVTTKKKHNNKKDRA